MYFYSILSGVRCSAWDGFTFIVNDRLTEPKNLKNLTKPLKRTCKMQKECPKTRGNLMKPEKTCRKLKDAPNI